MKSAFPGFSAAGIKFLGDLAAHNNREWFTPRKQIFDEEVRLPMIELVGAIHGEMLRFAPSYVGDAAKCVFRIYRDTRFSKDKTPYKTHIAASFWPGGLGKNSGAGFYFSVSPREIEIAGGLYSPEPDALAAVRQRIAEAPADFSQTYDGRTRKALLGELQGASITRPPRGFDPEHPAIDLLKRKQFCFFMMLDPALATGPGLLREVVKRFEAMTPFNDFLNGPLLSRKKREPLC